MAISGREGLPQDAVVVIRRKEWEIYYSRLTGEVYIYPSDYHPKPLRLSRGKLLRLLQVMDEGQGVGTRH